MNVGDVYYEKHTVTGISQRTGEISETQVEIIKAVPIDVLDKIRAEIEQMPSYLTEDGRRMIRRGNVFRVIDKYRKGD